MSDSIDHDGEYYAVAFWSAAAGLLGATTAALQRLLTWREWWAALSLGISFGLSGGVLVWWQWPGTPFFVTLLAALGVGYLSRDLGQITIKLMDIVKPALIERFKSLFDGWLSDKTKPPVPLDARPAHQPGSGPGPRAGEVTISAPVEPKPFVPDPVRVPDSVRPH